MKNFPPRVKEIGRGHEIEQVTFDPNLDLALKFEVNPIGVKGDMERI